MKRKGSMMGSSKYEFNPEQLDIDVAKNRQRAAEIREKIEIFLDEVIGRDPVQGRTNWDILIQVLRERATERNR